MNRININKNPNVYGFIPVRYKSERVKKKNFKKLKNGKSLLDLNLDLCKKLKIFKKIFVSSSKKINLKYKNFEFVLRSKKLSDNKTTLISVIHDFIKKKKLNNSDIIIIMLVTSPLKTHIDLMKALKIFLNQNKVKKPLLSICEDPNSIELALKIKKNMAIALKPNLLSKNLTKSKRLKSYFFNDAFVIDNVKNLLGRKSLIAPINLYYLMPEHKSYLIDTPFQMQMLNNYLDHEK